MIETNLNDLRKVILPSDTRVFAGGDSLTRKVEWVVTLPANRMPDEVARNDLVLLAPPYSTDLPSLIAALAERQIAAIALLGEPTRDAVNAAAERRVPLFALPADADLRAIQRQALTLLVNSHAAAAEFAAQVYDRMAQQSAEGAGLEGMAGELGRVTQQIILVQDKRLHPVASYVPEAHVEAWKSLEPALENRDTLPEILRDRKRAAEHPAALRQDLPDGWARLLTPIIVKGVARGFLSVIAPTTALDDYDVLLLERAAGACALEMAKAKAIHEIEKSVRGDFIDAILAGNLARGEASHWAARIAFPESGAYAALTLKWASAEHPSLRRLDTIVSGELRSKNLHAHARARGDEIVIFIALDSGRGIETAQRLADKIHRQTESEFLHARLATGLGRVVTDLMALRESYREAMHARSIAERLAEPNPLYFGNLSVYRLLFQLEDSPELESFCRDLLGPLIEYDRTQNTRLLETLSAYFAHQTNLSRTATALYVHRNTLLYRMRRIAEITHWDLNDPETRLAVQLALRAYRLVQSFDAQA